MQLQIHLAKLSTIRAFAAPARCPGCGDWMVAPVSSKFVEGGEGGEIRHRWQCDTCGDLSEASISIGTD